MSSAAAGSDTPLSLGVGIAGHIKLRTEDMPSLAEEVRKALRKLQQDTGLEIVVFCSLAEGADQLAARVAIEEKCRLVVPLPRAAADFETDFTSEAVRTEFRALLKEAERSFVVEAGDVGLDAYPESALKENDRGYRRAGLFIAQSCHVLLALWNGKTGDSPAGTWPAVHAKWVGESSIGWPCVMSDLTQRHGVVVHIVTPTTDMDQPPAIETRWPQETSSEWQRLSTITDLTAQFNGAAAALRTERPELIARSRRYLLEGQTPPTLPPDIERLADQHAVADALALSRQPRIRLTWMSLFVAAVLAVLVYAVYAHTHDHPPSILAFYLIALGLGFGFYVAAERLQWHPRFLDYRALAEGLRVAFFWRVAGLSGDVVRNYPESLIGELEWIRTALRVECARTQRGDPATPLDAAGLTFTREAWIAGQTRYFARAAQRNHHQAQLMRRLGHGLLLAGFVLAVATFVVQGWIDHRLWGLIDQALIGIAILPAAGGAFLGFSGRMAYETHARQYTRMADLFTRAQLVLDSCTDDSVRRMTMIKIADEAMAEHAQWVVLHRERPFEFVAGGG